MPSNKSHDPESAKHYNPSTCVLTLANGNTVDLSCYGNGDDRYPTNFLEAAGWHDAIRRGRPLPTISRGSVVRAELRKIVAGLPEHLMEKLLAAAQEIDGEAWTEHWRRQSARSGKHTH